MERQFTSGSRQAPDPFDQFLEEYQYYRKHTARDASCLFRVISEQMYDTQLHHLVIREKCVTYMRKHRRHFDYLIDRDFDDYLADMSKPKTYGTLLELQAASYMFERNVFLFQPFNLGNYFGEYRSNFIEVFRVFYTPERHFDSVFTSDYIQEAAICQSICYEILYKDLFKLPDVSFAVEQMLHGPTFDNMDYRTETNDEGYPTCLYLSDGRSFELDLPQNTSCILENYKLCHFHYANFPRYSDNLQRELRTNNCEEIDRNSLIIQRTAESFLPNKYVSCVRQLLQEGITPFPYKVAKALDPNMYRNIEFDSWNEMRKEQKLQNWYNGDANFKVGAKCHVKLRKSEQDLYTCHIQEIAVDKGQCIVFVEQLGEKRLVPYENLTPLPPDQFKPWTVPYRLQRHMQKYSSVRFTRQYNYRFKLNTTTEHHHEYACGSAIESDNCSSNCLDADQKKLACQQQNQHCTSAASYFKLKQYTHLEDFSAHVEYCTMPLTVAHSNREVDISKTSGNQSRMVDSGENSRTPSRSSTSTGMHRNNMEGVQGKPSSTNSLNNVEEHLTAPNAFVVPHFDGYDIDHNSTNSAFYIPEMHGFYPMYPAGIPEDYYGYYSFDSVIPPVNNVNGFYYLCNNAVTAPPNYINSSNPYFLPPPPPPQSLGVVQPSPLLATVNTPNPSYYASPPLNSSSNGTQCNQSMPQSSNLPTSVNNTPSRLPHTNVTNTPTKALLSGRINYDAKKSVKMNGIDLPNDVPTLRFFFNMGLDYYQKQKSNGTGEAETSNEEEKISNDFQNIKLDENANQLSGVKSDANNNNINGTQNNAQHANETNHISNHVNRHNANTNANGGGNKNNNNNQRRYNSRYFSGKERQMPQRNNPNQQHQQFHQNTNQHYQRTFNNIQNNNNTKYSNNNYNTGNIKHTTRNTHQQSNQQHYLQQVQHVQSQHMSHASAAEPNRHISSNSGFDDPSIWTNSTESQNCHTPTAVSVSNNGVANNSDQINEGVNTGAGNGQLTVSLQSNTSGVFIPIPMTAGPPPPPPPYGIFATHPTAIGPHQTTGVGMHPSYMSGPPPQIITHCGIPPPHKQQNTMNIGPGLDTMENVYNPELKANNGALMGMAPPAMQIQCSNYPPSTPFYYSSKGGSASGVNGSLPPAATNSVHLVAPLSHQIQPTTPSNQTAFASPHPSMGTQGFYCLQPPPLLPPQHQVTPQPQLVQHQAPISVNKTSATNTFPQDTNNGQHNNDLVQQNND